MIFDLKPKIMATFERIQHIGENIFKRLKMEDLLNCRLICASWKNILDNPYFWLKKLDCAGQPQEVREKWLKLIENANQSQAWSLASIFGYKVSVSKITKFLIFKYCKFIIHSKEKWMKRFEIESIPDEFQKFLLGLPPVYQVIYEKSCDPCDENVMYLIAKTDQTFNDSLECPEKFEKLFDDFFMKLDCNWINPMEEVSKINSDGAKAGVFGLMYLRGWMDKSEFNSPYHFVIRRHELNQARFIPEMKAYYTRIYQTKLENVDQTIHDYLNPMFEHLPRMIRWN